MTDHATATPGGVAVAYPLYNNPCAQCGRPAHSAHHGTHHTIIRHTYTQRDCYLWPLGKHPNPAKADPKTTPATTVAAVASKTDDLLPDAANATRL